MRLTSMIMAIAALFATGGCAKASHTPPTAEAPARASEAPAFNADSAYAFVAKQVEFGPRVPGTAAAEKCGDWIVEKLNQYGATDITEQRANLKAYNGDQLKARNITASFAPEKENRVLLLAHWDTRSWADRDKDKAKRDLPIDGANDGASGVGVMLEIARLLSETEPQIGVDMLFVDAEDYGHRADEDGKDEDEDSWALGTQYWAENPTLDLKKINYAILFDMVGGKDAVFPREYISQHGASSVVDKVWKAAKAAGYGQWFPDRLGGAVVDDHYYLLKARIPAIDIIESDHPDTGSFPPYWHTHADNLDNISTSTLKAVGQVATEVIFNK